jgi:hypothetical protein
MLFADISQASVSYHDGFLLQSNIPFVSQHSPHHLHLVANVFTLFPSDSIFQGLSLHLRARISTHSIKHRITYALRIIARQHAIHLRMLN